MVDYRTHKSEEERLQRAKELEHRGKAEPGSRLESSKGRANTPFDKAAETDKRKKQQAFDARFKTPQVREAAIEAESDARELKEAVELKTVQEVAALYRGLDLSRPVPPEYAAYINQKTIELYEQRQTRIVEIDTDLKLAFSQIETLQHEIERIGPLDESRQITYQPDYLLAFNRAAIGPGLDI